MAKIINVLLPAGATLDHLKAAYALYVKFDLRLCAFGFVYPHRRFSVNRGDVIIGANIDVDGGVFMFQSLADVIAEFGHIPETKYIADIPPLVLDGFRDRDKTIVLMKVFEFFSNYSKTQAERISVPDLVSKCHVETVCGHNVLSCEDILSPDERIVLFQNGYDYVVFRTNDTIGVQRNILENTPSLRGIRATLPDQRSWVEHNRGHLLISKGDAPCSLAELRGLLIQFLKRQ